MPEHPPDAKPLYANFLKNKGLYTRCQNYWQQQFDELFIAFDIEYKTYHEEKEARDGDPIFAAYFPAMQRAVRIVQKPPENNRLQIEASIRQNRIDDDASGEIQELIIELVLSKQSANLTRQLVRQWIPAYLPAERMEKEIETRLP